MSPHTAAVALALPLPPPRKKNFTRSVCGPLYDETIIIIDHNNGDDDDNNLEQPREGAPAFVDAEVHIT